MLLLDELVHFENVLPPAAHLLLPPLLLARLLDAGPAGLLRLRHGQNGQVEHFLHHVSMVGPVPIERVRLFLFLCLVERAEYPGEGGVVEGQIDSSHSIAIFDQIGCAMQHQSLSDILVAQLCSIVQGRVLIVVALVEAGACAEQQQAVFQLVRLARNMERSLPEISESVDIDSGVVDESAKDLYGTFHGGVVEGGPVRLIAVVDVDYDAAVLAVEDVAEVLGLVLHDGLQKLLVQLVQLLPVVLPQRSQDAALLALPLLRPDRALEGLLEAARPAAVIDLLNYVLHLRIFQRALRILLRHQLQRLAGLPDELLQVRHCPAVDYFATRTVHDYVLAFLFVVFCLDQRVDVEISGVVEVFVQAEDGDFGGTLGRMVRL